MGAREAPYLFKENGDSQWASAPLELLAVMVALWAFGFLNESGERRSIDLWVQGGTDNRSIEQMTKKAATTRWPLVLVNVQLSDALMKAGLRVGLKWRPRDENTIADDLTNGRFEQVAADKRVDIKWADLNFTLLEKLWEARAEFLDRDSWKFYHGPITGGPYEKTAWG